MAHRVEGLYPRRERKESYIQFAKMYMDRYGERIPNMAFNLDDNGSPVWPEAKEHSMAYNKNSPERKAFCGPDWTFWHWPSSRIDNSTETFRMILEAGESRPTVDKVAWFGNMHSAGPESPERRTRTMLVEHFGSVHSDSFDCFHVNSVAGQHNYMSLPDMTRKYRYLIDVGGAGYSGRTKFLMFSGRPLLLVDRRYVEYFNDDLKEWVHFIPVKEDLSDLLDRVQWLRDNESEANGIAERAKEYAIENFTLDKAIERLRMVCMNFIASGHARSRYSPSTDSKHPNPA